MAQQNDTEVQNSAKSSDTPLTDMLLRLDDIPQKLVELVEGLDTVQAFSQRTAELLMRDLLCPCYVLDLVRMGSLIVINAYAAKEKVKMVEEMTYLGVLTLELVGKVCLHRRLSLQGKWERIAFAAVSFVNLWMPGVFHPEPGRRLPFTVKQWVAAVMCRDDLCPNPVLRLELLRFAAMWDVTDFVDPYLGYYTVVGFMHNALHLTVSRLLPVGRAGLLCALKKLLYNLHTACQLGPFVEKSCREIERMQVREAERVFAYLVVLMGKAAKLLSRMRRKKLKSPRNTIEEFSDIVQILRLLTTVPPNQRLYEMPGMCQLAGGAIATTIRCIVLTPVEPQVKDHFTRLLNEVDDYLRCLGSLQDPGNLLDDLQRYHGRDLASFTERMRQHRCQPVLVSQDSQPLRKRRYRVQMHFMDSRTKRLMSRPVRLEATGKVVDYTTLLRLMMVNETDPDTGRPLEDLAYTSLDDLRGEIRAWKREIFRGRGGDDNSSRDDGAAQSTSARARPGPRA